MEILIGSETDDVIDELFESLCKDIKKQKKNREKEEANLLMKCWFIVF